MTYDPDVVAAPTDDLVLLESLPNVLSSLLDPEDSALSRRPRLRAAGLRSGRIPLWTKMGAAQLWREGRRRFAADDDLALGTLCDVADRLARDQRPKQQDELRQLKRALLRDPFSDGEHLGSMGAEEHGRLPLPFAGVIRALKRVGVRRAGCRLSEL